jgi:hypothetical protein
MTPKLSERWCRSSKTGVKSQQKQKHSFGGTIQSERSLTSPFGSPCLSTGVAFPIRSPMDVIRVPIDTFFLNCSLRVKLTGTSSTAPMRGVASRRRTATPSRAEKAILPVEPARDPSLD